MSAENGRLIGSIAETDGIIPITSCTQEDSNSGQTKTSVVGENGSNKTQEARVQALTPKPLAPNRKERRPYFVR